MNVCPGELTGRNEEHACGTTSYWLGWSKRIVTVLEKKWLSGMNSDRVLSKSYCTGEFGWYGFAARSAI